MNGLLSTMKTIGAVAGQLADVGGDSPSNVDSTTGHGPEWGEAAPVGLLVIVLLCIALYFLVKSLNRNLRKVPESFDPVPVSVGAPATTTLGTERTLGTASTDSTGSNNAGPAPAADRDRPTAAQ